MIRTVPNNERSQATIGKLSTKKYAALCVLGGEVAYFLCLLGGFIPMRNAEATKLHQMLFETLPGFAWFSVGSVLIGSAYVFVFAWIAGWYIAWMHNASLKN